MFAGLMVIYGICINVNSFWVPKQESTGTQIYLWYELPFWNRIFGDDHDKPNATVHFPWGSTHADAETAAHSVSPGDDGMLGPALKFSLLNCPSLWQKPC